MGRSAVHSIYN